MATSSFEKVFELKTEKEVRSFLKDRKNKEELKVNKDLASQMQLEEGVKALKKILSL